MNVESRRPAASTVSTCEADTAQIGRELARALPDGGVILLFGELGAGKTVFDGADDLRAHLQAEAAKLGGDAVIVRSESTDTEFILTGTARIKSDIRRAVGEVIVFDG